MDAQRALLDELMGAARNMTDEEKKGFREIKWDDRDVCSAFMVRFCPHDLFVNTKSDLGPCPKIHDQRLKENFEQSSKYDVFKAKFEADLCNFCEKLVMDLDRKVKRGRERLAQEIEVPPTPVSGQKSEKLSVLEEKIKKLLEQAETLGEAGRVDEAEALMRMVETLNIEKNILTHNPLSEKIAIAQEKKMALCETCGSFLVANDAVERTQSHVTGKQHIGYGLVRDFIREHKEAKEKAREEERLTEEKEVEVRKTQTDKESDSRGRRSVSGERNRSRERYEYRNQDRERDRSRDWNAKGNQDGGRGADWKHNDFRNGRDWGRDRYRDRNGRYDAQRERGGRDRSGSRSPVRHGRRRSSRSPVRPY